MLDDTRRDRLAPDIDTDLDRFETAAHHGPLGAVLREFERHKHGVVSILLDTDLYIDSAGQRRMPRGRSPLVPQ